MRDSFQTQSTRDAILDAADRLMARSGYKKMTIDELASEVGIGKGSIYLHFSSKDDIVLSQIDRIIERLKQQLATIADRRSAAPKRLSEMLTLRVLYRFDSVHTYSQNLNDLLSHVRAKLLERRKNYFEEEARLIAKVIKDGQADGDLAPGDTLDLARTLVTATNSLLPYSLSSFELGDRSSLEKITKKVTALLIRGLR